MIVYVRMIKMDIYEKGFGIKQSSKFQSNIEKIIVEAITKHINDLMFIMERDKEGTLRYFFANDAGRNFAKLSNDYMGKSFNEALDNEDIFNRLHREYMLVFHTKKIRTFIDQIKLDNGEIIYAESVLTPIMEDTHVKYIVSITRDITESLKKNELLQESEQRYKSLVDNHIDSIISIDMSGRIYDMNPAALKITGDENKQGTSIFNLIKNEYKSDFSFLFRKCKTTNIPQSMDGAIVMMDGQFLRVHIKFVPIIINESIQGIFLILRDISERAQSAEKIRYMSFHDQLTGLYNRRALMEDLYHEIKEASVNTEFALLTIDLDRFKYINDTFGHIIGDQILIKVAERLLEFNHKYCHVYRQGGDEFNILLTETNRNKVSEFAQNILSRFAQSFYLQSEEYYITPSIGISMYPYDGKDIETLIKNADEALFRVKERGKAHFQFYRAEMNMLLTNVVTLETNLRKAILNNELRLYYQPQVNLHNQSFNSVEALLRWESPNLGLVGPGDFIPLAEDTGLIIPIGNWVIEKACEQIAVWKMHFNKEVRIAINISPKQFQQSNFIDVIRNSLEKYKVNPSLLEIEITEGAMENTKAALSILRRLKEIGVIISVDDFGTGYSSLSYIKQFPIDVLKIDQSFVRDILMNAKDAAITTTIIHLGQNLGMEVIAEGVENKAQVDFLIKANCQKAQGYYYSKPVPWDKMEMFL